MIFVVSGAFCQQLPQNKLSLPVLHYANKPVDAKTHVPVIAKAFPKILPPISANYYSANLGFFCKQEIKMEKITKVPFKFRLGSVQQCDWLEGKRTATALPR